MEQLQEQEEEVLTCVTYLNFYELTATLRVGRITDMYEIMSTVNNAAKGS